MILAFFLNILADIEDSDNSQLQSSPEMYSLSFKETQDVVSIVGREIQLTKDYTTGNETFKQGSRGTVIEATSRKDGKLKVKLDNDDTKTFRLIKECDLQFYDGVASSPNCKSQTEEESFELFHFLPYPLMELYWILIVFFYYLY